MANKRYWLTVEKPGILGGFVPIGGAGTLQSAYTKIRQHTKTPRAGKKYVILDTLTGVKSEVTP